MAFGILLCVAHREGYMLFKRALKMTKQTLSAWCCYCCLCCCKPPTRRKRNLYPRSATSPPSTRVSRVSRERDNTGGDGEGTNPPIFTHTNPPTFLPSNDGGGDSDSFDDSINLISGLFEGNMAERNGTHSLFYSAANYS